MQLQLPPGVDNTTTGQKIVGGAVFAGLLALIGYYVLPFFITAALNIITFSALAGIIYLAWVARHGVYMLVKSLGYYLTRAFMELDPITALKRGHEWVSSELDAARSVSEEVSRNRTQLESELKKREEGFRKHRALGQQAQAKEDMIQAVSFARMAAVDKRIAEGMIPSLNMVKDAESGLKERIAVLTTKHREVGYEIEAMEPQYKALLAARKGLIRTNNLLNGSSPASQYFKAATEVANESMNRLISDVQTLRDFSQPQIEAAKFEASVADTEALALLN